MFQKFRRWNNLKIVFSGGGTAGHINPALAVADYISAKENKCEILFIGTKSGLESSLVPQAGYNIKYVKVEGLGMKPSLKNLKSLIYMIRAKKECKRIITDFGADIVVGTGGYVCAPSVMAANSLGIPTLIHEQNVFPGSAVRFLSKKSTVTAISFEESRKYLSFAKKILFTGNPIRSEILACNREQSRKKLNLTDEKFVVIFGGSLGAEKINSVTVEYLKSLYGKKGMKVLFATGKKNYDSVLQDVNRLNIKIGSSIQIVPYIYNMAEVMSAADLVVCRSGAITVSELCALGKPAILIPSPNVTHNHQEYNARALSDNGAAITILEKDFNVTSLSRAVNAVLDDEMSIRTMSAASLKIKSVDALDIIYNEIKKINSEK